MNTAIALLFQTALFWVFSIGAVSSSVSIWSLIALYSVTSLATALYTRSRTSATTRQWVLVLFYSVLGYGIFLGADFALTILGNSVKPRTSLPEFLGGLSLNLVFLPGIASIACGVIAAKQFKRLERAVGTNLHENSSVDLRTSREA